MKMITVKATTGTKGKPDYKEVEGKCKQYENLKEAIADLKEEGAVDRINRQIKTDTLNSIRKPSGGGLGKMVGKLAKDNPKAKAELEELAKKYGISL